MQAYSKVHSRKLVSHCMASCCHDTPVNAREGLVIKLGDRDKVEVAQEARGD